MKVGQNQAVYSSLKDFHIPSRRLQSRQSKSLKTLESTLMMGFDFTIPFIRAKLAGKSGGRHGIGFGTVDYHRHLCCFDWGIYLWLLL
jgi:hypothetical protein